MPRPDPLAWNGGVQPRPPSEGFATAIALGPSAPPDALAWTSTPAAAPRPPRPAALAPEAGPTLTVRRLDDPGPQGVRPSGRVRLTPT